MANRTQGMDRVIKATYKWKSGYTTNKGTLILEQALGDFLRIEDPELSMRNAIKRMYPNAKDEEILIEYETN